MLTKHEQLADHEARISRQELPPLQQPLDNIEQIKQELSHEWQPFETAPEYVELLWYDPNNGCHGIWFKGDIDSDEACLWQPLPPPPKEKK